MGTVVLADSVAMAVLADGVGMAVPAGGVTVGGLAGGVAVGGVSEPRERRLWRGAFPMADKSHGKPNDGTMGEREGEKLRGGTREQDVA